MTNKSSIILSAIKKVWNFFVGFSNIIGCIVSILSCYIAYTAVTEIISLNIDIAPIVEKFQKDSIVIIERPAPNLIIYDSLSSNLSVIQPAIEQDRSEEVTKHLSLIEIENIRKHRDSFLERMHLLFGK